uniref:Uncharacterized protein n=1 Tax=Timema shepardi TaxID=629360 RepID=A0A7R9BBY3_TIMSH|nr:unnamed protein product [Timema shepardi]
MISPYHSAKRRNVWIQIAWNSCYILPRMEFARRGLQGSVATGMTSTPPEDAPTVECITPPSAPICGGGSAPPSVWADLDTLDRLIFELEAENGGMAPATPPPPPQAAVRPLQPHVATSPQRQRGGVRAPVSLQAGTSSLRPLRQGDSSRPSGGTGVGGTIISNPDGN